MTKYSDERKQEIITVFKRRKSIMGTCTELGIPNSRNTVAALIAEWKKTPEGQAFTSGREDAPVELPSTSSRLGFKAPITGKRKVFIFSSEQNNTNLHRGFWDNLLALADHDDARIIVGRFVYRKDAAGQRGQEKHSDTSHETKKRDIVWSADTEPYVVDERLQIAPDLIWCGEMNILPTAERPLQGLDNYTGTKSAIFPHPKVALESIATSKSEPAKMNYTTGAITETNYIQRKAGQKAEFHHVIGALIVEVDDDGMWFARQINAASDGSFYDLDRHVSRGRVTTGHAVEGVNWGDIHEHHLEAWMFKTCWGQGGILDLLRPRFQFFHDLLDFNSRSHHDMKDPHEMYKKYVSRDESVKEELLSAVSFLTLAERQFCQSVVIESNHDNAYLRWVKEATHKTDHVNATFLLRSQLACYEAMDAANDNFHLFEWACRHLGYAGSAKFLDEDDSFLLCPDKGDGIECGMHGHLGLNGARGNAKGFTKMGRKLNIGHMHGAQIIDGVFVAGVMGALDQGYNVGPSNWSHSFIVTYPNGKRAIVTMRKERWRGQGYELLAAA